MSVIGTISGSGRVILVDKFAAPGTPVPEDLELEKVLGDLPQKTYDLKRIAPKLAPLKLPQSAPQSPARPPARTYACVPLPHPPAR